MCLQESVMLNKAMLFIMCVFSGVKSSMLLHVTNCITVLLYWTIRIVCTHNLTHFNDQIVNVIKWSNENKCVLCYRVCMNSATYCIVRVIITWFEPNKNSILWQQLMYVMFVLHADVFRNVLLNKTSRSLMSIHILITKFPQSNTTCSVISDEGQEGLW